MWIRPADLADAAVLAEIHVRSWQATYRGLIPQNYLDSLDPVRWRPFWEDVLRNSRPPTRTLLLFPSADPAARPIGFVSFGPTRDEGGDTGEIFAVYVLPQHWGTGGGRALLDAALTGLATSGFTAATLWVLDGNTRARRFYEAGGWTPDGRTKRDETRGFPLDEVSYRRALTG